MQRNLSSLSKNQSCRWIPWTNLSCIFFCLVFFGGFGLKISATEKNFNPSASGPPHSTNPYQQLQQLKKQLRQIQIQQQQIIQALQEQIRKNQQQIQSLQNQIRQLQHQLAQTTNTTTVAQPKPPTEGEAALESLLSQQTRPSTTATPSSQPPSGEEALEQALQEATTGPSTTPTPTAAFPGTSGLIPALQTLNPNISVVVDTLAHYTSHDHSDFDSGFYFRHLELSFDAAIDPYARAQCFIGYGQHPDGDWHTHVGEAYATLESLPYGLGLRIGRFRSNFGRANTFHEHALPWIQYPLVIKRFFGDEGFSGNGIGLDWLVPNPWNQFIEITYEPTIDAGQKFLGPASDAVRHLIHARTFWDLSPASTVELGLSYAVEPEHDRHAAGLDVTYKWRPPEKALYRGFTWQTEWMIADSLQQQGWETALGLYTALEYQFARRWVIGGRYDYTQFPANAALQEDAYSLYLTFLQSEFMLWRLGYRFTDRNFNIHGEQDEHQLMLQCDFILGAHPAHRY